MSMAADLVDPGSLEALDPEHVAEPRDLIVYGRDRSGSDVRCTLWTTDRPGPNGMRVEARCRPV